MTRKIWVDRKRNRIKPGMFLEHYRSKTCVKVTMNKGQLGIERDGGVLPLTALFYDDAYTSVDLKKNEYRLKEYEVVSYE